jgi:hypothetical protein
METPAGGIPGRHRSLVERMIGAAMLDISVYEEVEADQSATGQAAVVVAIVAVCAAIGSWGHGNSGVIGAVIGAFIGWLIMAALTYVIGTKLFKGTADMGEMLRTLGFAQSPGVIAILGIIPFLGRLIVFVVAIWQLVTAVVAIRQALDFDTGKAIATALISWIVVVVVTMVVMGMLLGTGMAVGALAH